MPNRHLIIRKENAPKRCEVCHQADLFDPETSQCQRCANLALPTTDKPLPIINVNTTASMLALTAAIFGIVGLLLSIFFGRMGLMLGIVGLILGNLELTAFRQTDGATGEAPVANTGLRRAGETFAYIGIYCGALATLCAITLSLASCWVIH